LVGENGHHATVIDDGAVPFFVTDIVGDRIDAIMEDGELELWHDAGEFTARKRTRQASTAADGLGVFGRGESRPNQEKGYQFPFLFQFS